MQPARAAFLALAALVLLATPTVAGNTRAQKVETDDSTPSCHSYQLGPDGNWIELPCRELGTHSSSQYRAPPKSHSEQAR